MDFTRPHWSYSAINQYLRCPLQFYFRRVLKLPEPTISSGLVLGSAVHNALAFYHMSLKQRRQTGTEDVRQSYLEHWEFREEEKPIEFKAGESRTNLIDLGMALIDLYLREPPPPEIVSVEQRILVPLHNSEGEYLETPLVAIADLVTRDEGGLKINEFKTSGRSYGELEVQTSLQATCYANAAWETFGEQAAVEYAVLVKTKTPKVQRIKTNRKEEDFGRLGDLVENVERAVNSGIFYPIETPLNCSTCPYRQQCRDWKPERLNPSSNMELVELNGVHSC